MEIITRQWLANEAAERWKGQYASYDGSLKGRSKEVYNKLIALGDEPDPDEVDSVIGNGSWTTVRECHECDSEDNNALIMVGEILGYHGNTALLCAECVKKAYNKMCDK